MSDVYAENHQNDPAPESWGGYSAHYSLTAACLLEIDLYKSCLQVGLTDCGAGARIVGEFSLAEAEEIAASIARVCGQLRKNRT